MQALSTITDSLPQLSLGTAALVIFGVCALVAALRGLVRVVFGTAVLALTALAAYWAWQQAPLFALRFSDKPQAWLAYALPSIAGAGTFLLARGIGRIVTRPFSPKDGSSGAPASGIAKLFALTFSLIPAGVLSLIGAMFVNHFGTLSELRASSGEKLGQFDSSAAQMKSLLAKFVPADLLQKVDPLADKARVKLAKLIAADPQHLPPKAIPVLEEPAMRAIVVDEVKLKNLAKKQGYAALLSHPDLDKALNDPKVRSALDRIDL